MSEINTSKIQIIGWFRFYLFYYSIIYEGNHVRGGQGLFYTQDKPKTEEMAALVIDEIQKPDATVLIELFREIDQKAFEQIRDKKFEMQSPDS